MPHLTIEYSANLDGRVDLQGLCLAIHKTIVATGLCELGALRVRALRAEVYAVADLLPENGFIDMSLRVGVGRTQEQKREAGDAIFATATEYLAPLFQKPHFALTLEVREIDPHLSWKKNAIHLRLRQQAG